MEKVSTIQTFLPYPDFKRTAESLDNKRLGKQRVETMQIMKALTDPKYGWQSHPAVKMWRGHEAALLSYQAAICYEWVQVRGFKDTCFAKTAEIFRQAFGLHATFLFDPAVTIPMPEWMGWESFHASHRGNLIRKDAMHYGLVFAGETWEEEYVWPVK